jgi:hypothetical protein
VVQTEIQAVNQKLNFFFKQEDSLPLKIKSLAQDILLYLNQFNQNNTSTFTQLHQLF